MQEMLELEPTPFFGFADPISSVLHLGGASAFAALGIGLLLRARGNGLRVAAIAIYVTGVVFALAMSGVFHLLARDTPARDVMMIIDHAGIFFLIAASYTPIHIIQFEGFLRWGILTFVWGAAISGIILKSVFFETIPEWVGLMLYLGLGWVGLISAIALYRAVGTRPLLPLLGGALAYTLGAVLEFERVPTLIPGVFGPHEIFHLLVLVGVGMHWMYIRRITTQAPITDLYRLPHRDPISTGKLHR